MGLSHQILLDIVEAGGEGFEVDDVLEFDYQSQYTAPYTNRDGAYYQVTICFRPICIYISPIR